MAHWGRSLVIIGLLSASTVTAHAADPFSGGVEASPKQPKAQDGFSPTPGTKAGSVPKAAAPRAESVPKATTRAPAIISDSTDYTIGPADVLDISVFGVADLSGTVEVAANGSVQLPLIGEVPAAGKTPEQLETDLTSSLNTYLQNPQVRVTVKEYKSRSVTVVGDIASNGVYPLTGETSLLQIVAKAGGFKDSSDETALIVRKRGGQKTAAWFDVSEIEHGRATDPILQSGDTIVGGKSYIKGAYNLFLKALPVAGVFALF
jgi:polysaccharide export outer membrane protein